MSKYYKTQIKNLVDKYIETEDTEVFGELLMALVPMIWSIVRRWDSLRRHHEDMHQEILMTLWKNQHSVNRLKSVRKGRTKNGDHYCMSTYFYFVIRGYMTIASERLTRIFEKDIPYRVWFYTEEWMGNLEIDEDTQSYEGLV